MLTRGLDKVSDCVAPQNNQVCHSAPLMTIYYFLNPENMRPRTTEFQPLFLYLLPCPNATRPPPSSPKQSLNLSRLLGTLTLTGTHIVRNLIHGC